MDLQNPLEQQIETQNKLAEELKINPVLAQLLVQRDICSFHHALKFFVPIKLTTRPFFNGRYG